MQLPLIALLSVVFAAQAQAAPGVCRYKESCGYHCCRGNPSNPQCLCSVCCNASQLGPDDRSADATDGRSTAKVYRHRVEFYSGRSASPRSVRRFEEGIYPIDDQTDRKRLMICTSPEWAVSPSTGVEKSFCGAFDLSGKELFRLKNGEGPGLSREPVGISPDGKEAVFSVTKSRKDGDREITGYRLWRRGRPEELLPADGERTRKILEKYQGKLVLTNPAQGD